MKKALCIATISDTIRRHIIRGLCSSNTELLNQIFAAYLDHFDLGSFDPAAVSRWRAGTAPISPEIIRFYLLTASEGTLAEDILARILPLLHSPTAMAEDMLALLLGATNISPSKKLSALQEINLQDSHGVALFVEAVVRLVLQSPDL